MRAEAIKIKVFHETDEGDELRCEFLLHHTPGFTSGLPENCYPDEDDVDDPEYFLNDEYISEDDLPDSLQEIATRMYEDYSDFEYTEVRQYED